MFAKLIVALSLLLGFVAAQIPTFPDNIITFPDNDIVEVLGFNGANAATAFTGRTMQVKVVRSIGGVSTVIGESFPTISGGNIAFDINHPFGYCWGVGSKYKVTPDIKAGDDIMIFIDGQQIGSSTVQHLQITNKKLANNVLTVTGTGVSALADPTFMDCRVVQPALVNTNVGRRDVRAIPLINFPNAQGYRSSITTNGDAFTCEWTFFDAAGMPNPNTAASAYTGIFLVSSWQATDAAGNAQGMTISEFQAAGGPMDGSCPPTANRLKPVPPSAVAYDGTKLLWNAASDVPGSLNAFNFYSAEILRPTATGGVKTIAGYKVASTALTASVVAPTTVLANDEIDVRAWQEYPDRAVDVLSASKKKVLTTITNVALPAPPTFSSPSNAIATTVSLSSVSNLQLAYTITAGTAGVDPVLGTNAIIYGAEPVKIVGTQTIVAVAFDSAGHVSAKSTATFRNPTPAKIDAIRATPVGAHLIRVAWTVSATPVTGYRVYKIDGAVKTLVGTAAAMASFFDVTDAAHLIAGNSYTFAVAAINTFNGVVYESAASDASNPATFVAGPDGLMYTINYKPGIELRIDGTGTIPSAVITVVDATTNAVLGSAALSNGVLKMRIRPASATITVIHIKSSFGFAAMNVPIA